MILDNSAWNDAGQFADYASALTDGCDFVVKYGGAPSVSLIDASNHLYWTQSGQTYGGFTIDMNQQLLFASATQDDRLMSFNFDLGKRQKVVLRGDSSEYIAINIRQSLAVPAIKILWATAGGFLI